jgi:hypothetical protein
MRVAEIGLWRQFAAPNNNVAVGVIVLQNSFLGCVQNFAGALVRSLENYVGGHMINPIFNRQPS